MRFCWPRILPIICFLLSFFQPPLVLGESFPFDRILRDLAPLESAVIKGENNRILINKGSKHGVHKGDLWMIYSAGQAVVDPETHKTIGSVSTPLALAKVIRPDELFSEVAIRCIGETCSFDEGIAAYRFREIEALFQDDMDGDNVALYERLRSELPWLDWKGYERAEKASILPALPDGVSFVMRKGRLIVWSGGQIVGLYESEKKAPILAEAEEGSREKGSGRPAVKPRAGAGDVRRVLNINQIVYSLEMQEIDGSNSPWLYYLTKRGLNVRALNSGPVFNYPYEGFGEIVNLSTGTGGLVALNIFVQHEGMRSRILRFRNGRFEVMADDVDYILGFFDLNGDGKKEELLAQDFDSETFFGPGVYKMELGQGSVRRRSSLSVPSGFKIFGALWDDVNSNGVPEIAYYNAGHKLVLTEAGKKRWESPGALGGSGQILKMEVMEAGNSTAKDITVWSRPAAIFLDNRHVIAVAVNRTNVLKMLSPSFENARIGLLHSSGGGYYFRPVTLRMQGAVQALCFYGNELYCVVVEGNFFTGEGQTRLFAIPVHDLMSQLR